MKIYSAKLTRETVEQSFLKNCIFTGEDESEPGADDDQPVRDNLAEWVYQRGQISLSFHGIIPGRNSNNMTSKKS